MFYPIILSKIQDMLLNITKLIKNRNVFTKEEYDNTLN